MLIMFSDWLTTLSLIFGGCCSNAITLEQVTSQYPNAGSLITFLQFFLISLHGLPAHLTWTRYGPRFKPRRVPLTPYLVQVSLFYLISLLNNAAFAYRIPMPVHIIFRSGGLVISMVLGWLVSNKRYSLTQILSVLMVTLGVVLTTLSASQPTSTSSAETNPYTYATGIAILTLALVFSGFLGLLQDWTYTKYGRPTLSPSPPASANGHANPSKPPPAAWQESMFYLHFLGLPLFLPLLADLKSQIHTINHLSPRAEFSIPLPTSLTLPTSPIPPPYAVFFPNSTFFSFSANTQSILLSLPTPYLPLLLNTLTQLLCIAGVHRLTTRVSALTVTLVLVVRKATSLILSLKGAALAAFLGSVVPRGVVPHFLGIFGALFDLDKSARKYQDVDGTMMWSGAALVMLGTVGYTLGTARRTKTAVEKTKNE